MSSYKKETKHPETGEWEEAMWLDDCFGPHRYGVVFPSDQKRNPVVPVSVIAFDPQFRNLETRERQDHTPTAQKVQSAVVEMTITNGVVSFHGQHQDMAAMLWQKRYDQGVADGKQEVAEKIVKNLTS